MTHLEELFKKDLVTNFGPDKMLPDLKFAEMEPGWDCGGGTYTITKEEVEKFAKLMGDSNTGEVNIPIGMIYIFGLRICWDRKVFIDQAVRAGGAERFADLRLGRDALPVAVARQAARAAGDDNVVPHAGLDFA